ncbi:Hypothetical predicted protein [Podarcis lilfordi]|uniref:Uncharacterized protein n=1 Tax=Podarcis lilfordi TaxID=74358 RepID=A0AA35KCR6_9SAUR|nr:Hypothetical predicted protein [Podarcis lilfordi]
MSLTRKPNENPKRGKGIHTHRRKRQGVKDAVRSGAPFLLFDWRKTRNLLHPVVVCKLW